MAENPKDWDVATKLIRGGIARSPFMETAEALYLTQGFTYDSAEGADSRFAGEDPGFVYSRFNNPTVKMFEDRLALLEGAEVCRAQATGMASIHAALMGLVRAGDHVVAGVGETGRDHEADVVGSDHRDLHAASCAQKSTPP